LANPDEFINWAIDISFSKMTSNTAENFRGNTWISAEKCALTAFFIFTASILFHQWLKLSFLLFFLSLVAITIIFLFNCITSAIVFNQAFIDLTSL